MFTKGPKKSVAIELIKLKNAMNNWIKFVQFRMQEELGSGKNNFAVILQSFHMVLFCPRHCNSQA